MGSVCSHACPLRTLMPKTIARVRSVCSFQICAPSELTSYLTFCVMTDVSRGNGDNLKSFYGHDDKLPLLEA